MRFDNNRNHPVGRRRYDAGPASHLHHAEREGPMDRRSHSRYCNGVEGVRTVVGTVPDRGRACGIVVGQLDDDGRRIRQHHRWRDRWCCRRHGVRGCIPVSSPNSRFAVVTGGVTGTRRGSHDSRGIAHLSPSTRHLPPSKRGRIPGRDVVQRGRGQGDPRRPSTAAGPLDDRVRCGTAGTVRSDGDRSAADRRNLLSAGWQQGTVAKGRLHGEEGLHRSLTVRNRPGVLRPASRPRAPIPDRHA